MSFISKIKKSLAIGIIVTGSALTITGATLVGVGCTSTYTMNFNKEEFIGVLGEIGIPLPPVGSPSVPLMAPPTTYVENSGASKPNEVIPGYTQEQVNQILSQEYLKLIMIGNLESASATLGLGSSNWADFTKFIIHGSNSTYKASKSMLDFLSAWIKTGLTIDYDDETKEDKPVKTYDDFRESAKYALKKFNVEPPTKDAPAFEVKLYNEEKAYIEKINTAYSMMVSGAVLLPIFAIVTGLGITLLVLKNKNK